MAYKSIYEQLVDELESKGIKHYKLSLDEDRATFNLPPELKPPTKTYLNSHNQPGLSKTRPNSPRIPGQPEDQNKQLRLPASSTIQSAAYVPENKYLLVSFKSGHTYSYTDVPYETIAGWEDPSTTSAGSYFHVHIRMSFKYQKM